ncbi:MAG: SMEK domain-containing protein [Clostridia bacterium]|nr:SMEK domain-containing protein [Clostridia bacterium]
MMINIEHSLDKKVREIEIDIKYDNFQTRKTEDFFLRLLNKVYPDYHFKNLGYDKTNTTAIDLIDEKNNQLAIQVTAQKTDATGKIENTLAKAIKYWKPKGVKIIWVLFISKTDKIKEIDTLNEYCNREGISIFIKTLDRIVGDINEKARSEIIEIDEFLKQETSDVYLGLSKLTLFKQIEKGEKFVNDNFFSSESIIYYSRNELKTIKAIAEQLSIGKLKEYCILGNPCSGKTTFAYSIIQKIYKRKVFYLNLSSPFSSEKDLVEELIQISHNYSVIIIDNVHDNIDLYLDLRERISKLKFVTVLYLSRYYKTIDHFNDESIYRVIAGMSFFRIDTNENFEEKVSGIIWKKTKLLIESGSQLKWLKGDFKEVLKNINRNLLKLNIALRTWEQKNSISEPITFDKIDSKKILQRFYEEHKINVFKSDALITYCLLFKNDIPFIPLRNAIDENRQLKEKGIILQYYKSDYCYFPHKDYAQLIYDSFDYIEGGVSNEKKKSLFKNYIHFFDLNENSLGLISILIKFHYSEEKELLGLLLNDEKIEKLLLKELHDSVLRLSQVITALDIIFLHSENIDKIRLSEYYLTYLEFFKKNKLSLFIEEHYLAFSRLLQLSNYLNIELNETDVSVTLKKNEKANTNSIVELTLRISRKKRESETILRILNSFDFSEWLQMIVELPRLPNITNSLSELNTSSQAKKLLVGLIRNIDWEKQYLKAKSLKIDQFVKSLREINRIDISIGSNVSMYLFHRALKDSLIKVKLNSANLSEYSKALSDLSKLDSNFVKIQLAQDLRKNIVFEKFSNEPRISNFTARALELRKHFDDSRMYFEVLNKIVLTNTFIENIQSESNLNYLLIFTEFAEKYLNFEDTILKYESTNAITKIIAGLPNKLEALSNPKFLNVDNLDSDFIDSITTKEIEKYFESNKITYAEDLFRVLSSIDKDKTIEKFQNLNNAILIRALLNPELNFSQALEDLNKLKNKVYKNTTHNCNLKVSAILDNYLAIYTKDYRRYHRVGISDFFKGFYFGLCINQSIIEQYCKGDFLKKLSSKDHRNIEIASLFQFVRRLSETFNNRFDKELTEFLKLNTDNFIETIRHEDITKTLSGLSELALTKFDVYGDGLLFKTRNIIIKKMKQRKKEDIYRVKLIPDLEKIAKDKGRIILKELRK